MPPLVRDKAIVQMTILIAVDGIPVTLTVGDAIDPDGKCQH